MPWNALPWPISRGFCKSEIQCCVKLGQKNHYCGFIVVQPTLKRLLAVRVLHVERFFPPA